MHKQEFRIIAMWLCGALAIGVVGCVDEEDAAEKDAADLEGTDDLPDLSEDVTLPIVFIHGFAGSAQQYQSQAMRFAANGYPMDRIHAYDHDGESLDFGGFVAGADVFIDDVLDEHGAEQVFLVGHSRGTNVSNQYLEDEARAAKVAKYISLDGFPCPSNIVDCININQGTLPGQAHVEVAVSAESFELQYEFLVGEEPEVVEIVRQSAPVEVSGRAVFFPQNTGRDGTTLEIYEIDSETGARVADEPHATFEIGANGDWGPVELDPDTHYEKALIMEEGNAQHFYTQPYLRSTRFARLLSGASDGDTASNTHSAPGHAAVIAMRMREWTDADSLQITTTHAGGEEGPIEVMTDRVSAGGGIGGIGAQSIAIHLHDAADSPGESTLGELPNLEGPFQTTADVYMPASDPPDGTITFRNEPRGDTERPQYIRTPNWTSDGHLIMVMFSDFTQD